MRRVRNISQLTVPLSILVVVLAVQTAALPTQAHAPGAVLSGFGTATIDGVISPGEWDDAGGIDFAVNVPRRRKT